MTEVETIDYASEIDRVWFERHPEESEYNRPLIDGEFPGFPRLSGARPNVCVTQVIKGVRTRRIASKGFAFLDAETGAWSWVDGEAVPE